MRLLLLMLVIVFNFGIVLCQPLGSAQLQILCKDQIIGNFKKFINVCEPLKNSTTSGCSCEDEKPTGALDCAQLLKLGQCGTSTTQGQRYCKCSCGFCPANPGSSPPPTPTLPPSTPTPTPPPPVPIPVPPASVPVITGQILDFGIQAEIMQGGFTQALGASVASGPTLGFTVGSAKGIDNFRSNVENDFLPSPYDVTYEGIFNDYFFDTSDSSSGQCKQLFCPSYSAAVSPDPLYQQSSNEYYLAVGLDSGLAAASFDRKPLNVVILLDISGSMRSQFNEYAYDGPINNNENWSESKLAVAKTALKDMLQQLRDGDQLSIVTFDSSSDVLQQLEVVSNLDMNQLKSSIDGVLSGGSTDLESGYRTATQQLTDCFACVNAGLQPVENRIIILTDAQPNSGDFSDVGLASLIDQNSKQGIFTSIVGIGLDFNSELIESITKTRGANYFNVFSPTQFRKKLNEEFEFMVTPLVFDLKLEIDSSSFDNGDGWQVIKVYGSPNIDGGLTKEGTLIEINTLFPSPKTEEGIKGGVVLLKLFKPKKSTPLKLKVTYTERDTLQKKESSSQVDLFDGQSTEFYGSSGVRKAIVLSRYIDLLRGWLIDQYQEPIKTTYPIYIPPDYCFYYPTARYVTIGGQCQVPTWCLPIGPILPVFDFIIKDNPQNWERVSQPLRVSKDQAEAFEKFKVYLQDSIVVLGDETMRQEVDILDKLINISL